MSKFKVGDRVAVYEYIRKEGTIDHIDVTEKIHIYFPDGGVGAYHQKQCRRLVKKKDNKFKAGDRIVVIFPDINEKNTGEVVGVYHYGKLEYRSDACGNVYTVDVEQCRHEKGKKKEQEKDIEKISHCVDALVDGLESVRHNFEIRISTLEENRNRKCPSCGGCGKYHPDSLPGFVCGVCRGTGG